MNQKPKSADIHLGPGFRIREKIERLPTDVIERRFTLHPGGGGNSG